MENVVDPVLNEASQFVDIYLLIVVVDAGVFVAAKGVFPIFYSFRCLDKCFESVVVEVFKDEEPANLSLVVLQMI